MIALVNRLGSGVIVPLLEVALVPLLMFENNLRGIGFEEEIALLLLMMRFNIAMVADEDDLIKIFLLIIENYVLFTITVFPTQNAM